MDSNRYQRAKSVFFQACDCPAGRRAAYVEQACADDLLLRDAVLQLLSHDADPLTLVDESALRLHLEQMASSSEAREPDSRGPDDGFLPKCIGRYRILSLLGEGGMGVVYLAEQENPRRQVALKVIARSQASPHILRRFAHEAQILGRLHHPGIAQIYEAGTHDDGRGAQPFFAMELVRGLPLLRYCERTGADVESRLTLFIEVCEAVQHAHYQGVIHRDLKPANILVRDEQSKVAGQSTDQLPRNESAFRPVASAVKILDFGVARLTESDVQVTTMHTAADQIIGTVSYMSPEQLSGLPDDVNTQSDVYALGVILFELLTARLPHDVTGKTMPEAIRIVGQDDPTSLSALDRSLRGDLETIVGKALERDKSRRYQSANELAAEVRRYLDDRPIHARPPSTVYQFRKFAKRNRALVAGVIGVFVMLVLGIVGTSWQARQAIAARDKQIELRKEADDNAELANVAAAKFMAVNQFLRHMLASAQPENAQGHDVMVGEVLDAAAREIDGAQTLQPDVEAMIRMTIGETYLAIGRVPDALVHSEKALELNRRSHGEMSPEVGQALLLLALVKDSSGDWQQAIVLAERALAIFRTVYPADHADTAAALSSLSQTHNKQAEMTLAISLKRQSLEMLERLHGNEHMDVANAQARLAEMLHNPREAEPVLRQALETFRRRLGERHPVYIDRLHQYGGLLLMGGDTKQAEAVLKQSIELATLVYGPNHPDNLTMLLDLAFCYRMSGERQKHLEVCERAVVMAGVIYGQDNMRVAEALMDRADVKGALGDDEGLLADYRAAFAIAEHVGQSEAVLACTARLSIAAALLRLGRDADEAVALCHDVARIVESPPGVPAESQWMIGQALILQGEAAQQRRAFPEAEPLFVQGFEKLGTYRQTIRRRRIAAEQIVRFYEAWDVAEPDSGKMELADQWRSRLEDLVPRPMAAP